MDRGWFAISTKLGRAGENMIVEVCGREEDTASHFCLLYSGRLLNRFLHVHVCRATIDSNFVTVFF